MISDHPTSGGVHIFDNFIDPETASRIEKFILKQPKTVLNELTDDGVNYVSTTTKDESGQEIFVHATGLEDKIKENDTVTFDVAEGKKGLNAVNVKRA